MANYELSILRNTEPIESKELAISVLDSFDNHIIGQPISLLYYNDSNDLKVLFAVGKKNAYDTQPGELNYGRDFYDLIGEIDGKIFWKQIQGGNAIVDSQLNFEVISATQEEFDNYSLPISDNIISFVDSRIYKGNNMVSSLYLDDLSLYSDIEIQGSKYSGNFIDILQTIISELGVKWNGTDNRVKFEKTTNLDLPNKTLDDNTIYQISSIVAPDVVQHDLYIGSNRIGGNYNTTLDMNKELPASVGGIKRGTTVKELIDKGSISAIIDELLFSESIQSNPWEDIDAVLEANSQILL